MGNAAKCKEKLHVNVAVNFLSFKDKTVQFQTFFAP